MLVAAGAQQYLGGHGHQGQLTQAIPLSYHQAPIVQNVIPIASHGNLHSAPISYQANPIISQVSPVLQHSSPILYNQHNSGHGQQDYYVSQN